MKEKVICPHCGKPSDSIKSFTLPRFWLFLMIFYHISNEKYVACPRCMKKEIIKKGFTYNILTANALWLVAILPWSIALLKKNSRKGHFDGIDAFVAEGLLKKQEEDTTTV